MRKINMKSAVFDGAAYVVSRQIQTENRGVNTNGNRGYMHNINAMRGRKVNLCLRAVTLFGALMLGLYPPSTLHAQEQGGAAMSAARESNCGQLKQFIADLDAKLSTHPRGVSPLNEFVAQATLTACEENIVRDICTKSAFFQSERTAKNTTTRSFGFRFGTESILVAIGYYPDAVAGEQFPPDSRYVIIKKT